MKPLLLAVNRPHFFKLLGWKNIAYDAVGSIAMVKDFDEYNHLIHLNSLFSTFPRGDPVDRTQTIKGPFNFGVLRPWAPPIESVSFEQTMHNRVTEFVTTNQQLNLFWSGGIDSTCLVAGFLKNTTHLDQLRVLYTPFSVYENREFFEYLQTNYPTLDMVDISGDVYIDTVFDGIMINGHGGDEFTASLDESFFDTVGHSGLHKPWQDLVTDPTLQEFCTEYFALAGRPIETVLEARWWFYALTKSQVYNPQDSMLTNATTSAFFDCKQFEDYMWHNTHKIIEGESYNTYKQFMKQYIYSLDRNDSYLTAGKKTNSPQLIWYRDKKLTLLNQYWIALLTDNTVIKTPSLPLFSKLEFDRTYGDSLDYLFNT